MSSNYTGNPNNFLPETYIIPEDVAEKDLKLGQYLNDISAAVNTKESTIYDVTETVIGSKFLPLFATTNAANATYRTLFRVVIDTGALPNASTKSVPHGISTQSSYTFVKIYGAATDPGVSTITAAIPLPFINTTTPGDSVQIDVDATNINITTTTANYVVYTSSFVIVEYVKVM